MEINNAVTALSALAQESRLQVFRMLVRAEPRGMLAGEIADQLKMSRATLSFHLKELVHSGLVDSTKQGRTITYAIRSDRIRELMGFLMEDCCQGRPELCLPVCCEPADAVRTAECGMKAVESTEQGEIK
ncbi:MAG: metalloregulator ArsR/SmtB family transcription factor [Pirellulaceae bacterium]